MRTAIETPRLLLRQIVASDDAGMFELDSDPDVHLFLGKNPVTSIEQSREIIASLQQQYLDNGIARWAVILKNRRFIGWSGLKLERNVNGHERFYDLGYRFIKKHCKGYGFESAKAFVDFGFNEMNLDTICASFEHGNTGSQRIMEKCGMHFVNDFLYEDKHEKVMCSWYEIKNPNVKSNK
jgi:RimJ/RimL family protein N-acetyltransferase